MPRQRFALYGIKVSNIKAESTLPEAEFWRIYDLVRGDVEAAIKTNNVYLTVNRLAAEDKDIRRRINKHPEFWRVVTYSTQRAFFLAVGRIFDKRRDSHSVQKLVESVINNLSIFSKPSLRERKRQSSRIQGADPSWLTDYIAQAWEPQASDLEVLRTALDPYCKKFKDVFEPVRHKAIAHNSMEDAELIWNLFQKVLIVDIEALLGFLHTLVKGIWELAWNAKLIDLADFSDYRSYLDGMNEDTERFIRQLP